MHNIEKTQQVSWLVKHKQGMAFHGFIVKNLLHRIDPIEWEILALTGQTNW